MAAAVSPEETRDVIPTGPCGNAAEREPPTGALSTKQGNQAARPGTSARQPRDELEMRPKTGVARGGDGLDWLVEGLGIPEFGAGYDGLSHGTRDDGIAAADWLDVTHAMLGVFDEPVVASR